LTTKELKRRVSTLLKHQNISSSDKSEGLLSIKHPNVLIGVVEQITPSNNYIKIYLFSISKSIDIPNQYELGLKENDLVALISSEGIYQIIGRTNIEFTKKEYQEFNIGTGELNVKKIKDSSKYFKDVLFKDFSVGEIIRNLKLTGYRINEKFLDIFSGITKITVSFKNILMRSFSIYSELIKNESFKHFKETEESNAYNVEVYTLNDNKNILIEIKGDVATALQDYEIDIKTPPFVIEESIYFKATLNKESSFKQRNKITHSYIKRKNSFTGDGENKINKNVFDRVGKFASSKNIFEKNITCFIGEEEYFVESLEINTFKGEVKNFQRKKISITTDEYNSYSYNYSNITDKYTNVWQSSFEEYNAPYNNTSFKIKKNYSSEENHNLNVLLSKRWNKYFEKNIFADIEYEECKDCDIKPLKIEKVSKYLFSGNTINYQMSSIEESNPSISFNLKENNKDISINISPENGFNLQGQNKEKYSYIVNSNIIYSKNIKQIVFDKAETIFADKANMYLNSIYLSDLYIKDNFYLTGDSNCIIQSKTFYCDASQTIIKSPNLTMISDNNITLYVAKKLEGSKDTISSALMMTPSLISTTANITIPGYCKC